MNVVPASRVNPHVSAAVRCILLLFVVSDSVVTQDISQTWSLPRAMVIEVQSRIVALRMSFSLCLHTVFI